MGIDPSILYIKANSHEMPAMSKVTTPDKDEDLISKIIIN